MKKELLFLVGISDISVLVPKRRGDGYLRVPYGHHQDRKLNDALDRAKVPPDNCGLDGHLEIYFDYRSKRGPREALPDLMRELSIHYGFPAREVYPEEFWQKHPISS